MFIYILKLSNGKYYVGKTDNINKRFSQHLNGVGAKWTEKYKPLDILVSFKSTSIWDEDNYTLEYMYKYGIENVRGGRYVQIVLTKSDIKNITRSIDAAYDRCYKCHFEHEIGESCADIIIQNCKCGVLYHEKHICDSGVVCHKCNTKMTADVFYKHMEKCTNALNYLCYCCNKRVIIRNDIGYIKLQCDNCEKFYDHEHKKLLDTHKCKVRSCANCDQTFTGRHTCEKKYVKTHCNECLDFHNKDNCMKYLLTKIVKSTKYELYKSIKFFIIEDMDFDFVGTEKENEYLKKLKGMNPSLLRKLNR